VALSNRRVSGRSRRRRGGGDQRILTGDYKDNVTKVPWLGDIPILGWAFKTVERSLQKKNLLVFLTPHIVRSRADLVAETIRKRAEWASSSLSSPTPRNREWSSSKTAPCQASCRTMAGSLEQ
jgi:type II secretory pathway component GspD/PulD (secretin)